MTCGECEYFGDYDKQILGPWEPVPGSEGNFIGRPSSASMKAQGRYAPLRSGTKCRVYDHTIAWSVLPAENMDPPG